MLLQHIWQYGLYDRRAMKTTDGLDIEVVSPGMHNTNAGPDFIDARIKIGSTLWVGCVEIHRKSSDWQLHKHSGNPAYNNVVLHVVLEHDTEIRTQNGVLIPVTELKFHPKIEQNYRQLYESRLWIPCESRFSSIEPIFLNMWIESLSVERMERKSEAIISMVKHTNQNYNEAFYRLLASNFGFKTNAAPFERLARSLPIATINKIAGNAVAIEAALFGQAGFLSNTPVDDYQQMLQQEYLVLQHRFSLTGLSANEWKFFRLRPANFPTVRLAQFSALLAKNTDFMGLILDSPQVPQLRELFRLEVSDYWQTHHQLGKESKRKTLSLGNDSIDNILINTVCPFLFVYGLQHGDEVLKNRALGWLEDISAEENNVISGWRRMGANAENARHSQAYLELKTRYCDARRCLECQVGCRLVAEV